MTLHPVTVGAPRTLEEAGSPLLLQREDQDFVNAVLAELPTTSGRSRLAATRAKARDAQQNLKLFPPVQRRFHLALIEARCETAGRPRVDPSRVEAAGLVLRRVRSADGGRYLEGWMRAGGVIRGWLPVDRLGEGDPDPRADVRVARKATGVASLDRALRALEAGLEASELEEDVAPMFIAPPDVCCSTSSTIYYGVVPTASGELAQAEPDVASLFAGFGPTSTAFRNHLVQPLRGVQYTFPSPPASDRRFDRGWLDTLLEAPSGSAEQRFLLLLRQVAVEFDAFGDSASSRALLAQLDTIRLVYVLRHGESRRTVGAATFLRQATDVLLEGGSGSVEMPATWPALSTGARTGLANSLSSAMLDRFKTVKGKPGRFDEPDATYVLRAFVRLKPENGCRGRTVWSDYSEPFVIAPWYETAGDPVQVALPDLSNRDILKSLKPNVAFTLPPALNNLLSGNPKDLMEGKGSGSSVGIGWICSFSIPVITFCAFIVLNIFLSLFDLIFRWMLFIKVCIPYPKAK